MSGFNLDIHYTLKPLYHNIDDFWKVIGQNSLINFLYQHSQEYSLHGNTQVFVNELILIFVFLL